MRVHQEVINMFLNKEELGSVIYGYQIDQITEHNDDIVLQAISAAVEEVKSYLTGNNKTEWLDGRINYDIQKIFEASGTQRNALILAHTKTVTKWYIVELCNADIIYEQAKERYDRTVNFLKLLAKGEVTLSSLPTLETPTINQEMEKIPFRFGSRKKFKHE